VARDSKVGMAIRYRTDGREIESWWRRDFPFPSSLDLGPA